MSHKKVSPLFKLRTKKPHSSCVSYEGAFVCNETYIGEIKRNVVIRWDEHEDPKKESETAKHLRNHPGHSFFWKILLSASANNHVKKIMEASMIVLKRPTLSEQVELLLDFCKFYFYFTIYIICNYVYNLLTYF